MVHIQEKMGAKGGCAGHEDPKDVAVRESLARIKHKFIVMSGKGGVGKTSTAVNIAIALAAKGFKVGLMDVDLHGPDVAHMLGFTGMLDVTEDHKLNPIHYSDNLKAVSIEALLHGKDDAIIWRGPIKYAAIKQFIGEVAWGDLDFLIIDAPPGTGDEPLTVAQTITDAKAIVVTTPQEMALADVRKSINFCKTVKLQIFGVVENMSGYKCPHCNQIVDLFGSGGGEKMAGLMGVPFLGKIPFDQQVVVCGDQGCAYQDKFSDSPVSKAIAAIADRMAALL